MTTNLNAGSSFTISDGATINAPIFPTDALGGSSTTQGNSLFNTTGASTIVLDRATIIGDPAQVGNIEIRDRLGNAFSPPLTAVIAGGSAKDRTVLQGLRIQADGISFQTDTATLRMMYTWRIIA